MKIRTGFVSNSSSSSFAILGINLGRHIDKITAKDLKEYDEIVVQTGMSGEGGTVLIHIKGKEMLKFVQDNDAACKIEDIFGSYGSGDIKTDKLPKSKKLSIECWESEQSSPWDIESLAEYLEYEKDSY